jgi:hypothetical protein
MFHYVIILRKIQSSVLWVNKTWVLFMEEFLVIERKAAVVFEGTGIHIYQYGSDPKRTCRSRLEILPDFGVYYALKSFCSLHGVK